MKSCQYFVFCWLIVLSKAEKDISGLLSTGAKNFTIKNHKSSILVVGLTGTGKSNLGHYVATDENQNGAVDEIDYLEMANEINMENIHLIHQTRDSIWKNLKTMSFKERTALNRKLFFQNYLDKYQVLMKNIITHSEFVLAIKKFSLYTNVTISNRDLEMLITQQELIDNNSNQTIIEWINCFSKIHKKLTDEITWYTYLDKLIFELMSYDAQKSPVNYNLKSNNISIENFTLNLQHLVELNYLRREIFRSSLKFECKNNTILYHASIIFLSEIDYTKCPNVTNIHLIAQEKIFIDESKDFRALNGFILIADQIEVVNNVTIDLSGFNGEDASPSVDGTEDHPKGIPGINGMPGQNGGTFFAHANKLFNGNRLKVIVSGGNGGRGQNGSRAYSEKPELDRNELNSFKNCNIIQFLKNSSYHYRRIDGVDLPECENVLSDEAINPGGSIKIFGTYTVYAQKCCKDGEPGKGLK